MTINQNTKYILDHPQTKEAVEEYSKGNTKPLERLLFEIQFHVFGYDSKVQEMLSSRSSDVKSANKYNKIILAAKAKAAAAKAKK